MRLQFGPQKCLKLHVGRKCGMCPDLSIDTWKLEKASEEVTSVLELVDAEGEKHIMEEVDSAKYLGDIIQTDGKNKRNIQERKNRGLGAVNQIQQLLDDLCLGDYHFEAANILRNSLLLSSLVSNSETWYDVTKKEIIELESVDEILLRKIFSAHSKTPRETLYLESGNIPIRFILMSRRLNFLHYILNEEEDSLLRRFFEAQISNPVKGDWVVTVKKDLEDLGINQTFLEFAQMSKTHAKKMIREKVEIAAFNYLSELKSTHSKARNLQYSRLRLQSYLKSDPSDLSIQEKQFAFAARTRMLDVKGNFKIGQVDAKCRRCLNSEETQEHLLHCPTLMDGGVVSDVLQYDDLLGEDTQKIKNIARILLEKFKIFKIPCAPSASAATAAM